MCYNMHRRQENCAPAQTSKKLLKKFLKTFQKPIDNSNAMWYNVKVVRKRDKLGSIAQLGEHLPYKQRVTGSSPVVPTIPTAR